MQINKEWHSQNKMPKNATIAQRVKWHIEHVKQCGCREIPKSILRLMKNKSSK